MAYRRYRTRRSYRRKTRRYGRKRLYRRRRIRLPFGRPERKTVVLNNFGSFGAVDNAAWYSAELMGWIHQGPSGLERIGRFIAIKNIEITYLWASGQGDITTEDFANEVRVVLWQSGVAGADSKMWLQTQFLRTPSTATYNTGLKRIFKDKRFVSKVEHLAEPGDGTVNGIPTVRRIRLIKRFRRPLRFEYVGGAEGAPRFPIYLSMISNSGVAKTHHPGVLGPDGVTVKIDYYDL